MWLNVGKTGGKSWVFRWTKKGHVREMGIGPFPAVSLANARKKAFEYRQMVANGLDPKAERDRQKGKTFGEVADAYFDTMQSRWTSDKTRWQWKTTLTDRGSPIRKLQVSDIGTPDILKILNPIWNTTPETASRVRIRMENVLDYAKAKNWRDGENPARWRGHLANILPARQNTISKHHSAMAYEDMPDFWPRLIKMEALAARALELLILTACRTSEVLNATWDEFYIDRKLWTIPAQRMKMNRDHRIPLTDYAIQILGPLLEAQTSKHVFPGEKEGKPLSNMSMAMLLRRMKLTDITVHGFRSTFRDWCGDETNFPREIAEAALAHKIGNDVEQAYRRSDALEKRRRLMEAWSSYCNGSKTSKIVKLHG